MARLAQAIGICLGVAFAAWLLPASVHIVGWTPDGAVRVALLAPLWKLWIFLAIAAAVAIGLSRSSLSLTPYKPLALLWLWALPYLPWLPDRAPALLALAGPLRWGVVAMAACGLLSAAVNFRLVLTGLHQLRRTVFAISLALYLGVGLWSADAVGPGADEPHYLVITQSLLRDRDLAIENNHARGDFKEYFGGDLRPDFLRRGLNEVIYSIHAPGLPALLVPAYAVAGYRGAVVMVCLFGALAALAIFDLAALLAGAPAALLTWAAVCLTVPFVPHSWLIFPEMPGALLVAWAALWLYAPLPSNQRAWIWRGAALALLPWLHTKFVILLAAMLAALCLRLWRTPKAIAALAVPAVVSVALWIGSFYWLYGSLDPQVPYGDFPKLYVLVANIPRGVLGLLFDQKFGLLMYAPVYVLAIAGCWSMIRRSDLRLFGAALALVIVGFVASSTRMYMWWGGSSAPARFLVPILPLAAPLIAIAFERLQRNPAARGAKVLLLAVSLAVTVVGVAAPKRFMLFSAPHGLSNMATAAQGGSPLPYLLPTFTEDQVMAPLAMLAPWAVAALGAWAVVLAASRSKGRLQGFAAASAGLAVFVVGGAVLAGAPREESVWRPTAQRGRLDLLRAFDDGALRGYDYARQRTLSDRELLDFGAVHVTRADGALSADPRRLAGPFDLPAGRFHARVGFAAGARHSGTTRVLLGGTTPIAQSDAAGSTPVAFDLPVDATVWIAVSDGTLAAAAEEVDVVADSVVERRARPDVSVHGIEPIDGGPARYIVYADDHAYPEGGVFWTRGTSAATVMVAPGGATTLVLTLHVGPAGGVVELRVDGADRSVTLSRDETRQVEVALPPGVRLVPVVVRAPGRFRPSDHETGSTDQRWLGCQVRIGLR